MTSSFVWHLAIVLLGTAVFSSARSELLDCPEEVAQDFLKHEIVKRSFIPEEAQKRSIEYRVLNYGHTSPSNLAINKIPVSESIRPVRFLGASGKVHVKIIQALKCVEQKIVLECLDTSYQVKNLSTYRPVNSYRGWEISNHVFGTAIDIDPLVNPCCGCVAPWSEHPSCRQANSTAWDRVRIPHCWIHAFEKFGFYWLGRDQEIQDTMHFEYLGRPEIWNKNQSEEKILAQNCPVDMLMISRGDEQFCIDRFEAPNKLGVKPFVARTALEGEKYCHSVSKELCSDVQWEKTCHGPDVKPYPYGQSYVEGTCNDDKAWRSPVWPLVARFNPEQPDTHPAARDHVNYLDQSEKSGSREGCLSSEGAYDLTGNAAEWVKNSRKRPSQADGQVYAHNIKGCYWSKCYKNNRPSCAFTNSNHASSFRSYETGFRCCSPLLNR